MSFVAAMLPGVGVMVLAITLALVAPVRTQARTIAVEPASVTRGLALVILEAPEQRPGLLAVPRADRRLPGTPTPPPSPTPEPTAAPAPAAAPAAAAVLGVSSGPGQIVIASWYGPGFYGNRTACGQLYTPQIIGVAHKTLPCGTMLRLEFRGTVVTVPVIDRGPYIAGRTLDLSNATRGSLACTDLCPVRMQIVP